MRSHYVLGNYWYFHFPAKSFYFREMEILSKSIVFQKCTNIIRTCSLTSRTYVASMAERLKLHLVIPEVVESISD